MDSKELPIKNGGASVRALEPFLPEPTAIRSQLDRLLASSHFRNSRRCHALLTYVVNAHLEGFADRVKERVVGVEVFQREADYDTNHDSVVRTTAAEVRKRLAQYYMEPGHEHELRISLPSGSYAAEFHSPVPSEPVAPVLEEFRRHTDEARVRLSRSRRFWPIVVLLAALVAGAGVWRWQRSTESALERFWNPLTEDRADAVICIEQPLKLYRIEGPRADELNDKMVGTATTPPANKDVLDNTPLKLSDLWLAGPQYFSFGDLMAAVRLSELLSKRKKAFQVLGDRAASYHDLRGKPAILVGQFNNRWTLGLAGGLRYYLERDATHRRYEVHDRQNQGKVIASASRSSSREAEYAIVSRVLNPATEKTVVAIMGMTQQGTIAGGDFLTNAAYLQDAFQKAPPQWYRKNIQVVLRTAMISGTAGPPEVVATHFW